MNEGVRRGVTRGYVFGLIAATLIFTAALVVMSWGMLGLLFGHGPIVTDGVPLWFGVFTVAVGLVMLGVLLWRQALSLLRGSRAPVWSIVIGAAFGIYLLWCLFGIVGGLQLDETWASLFAIVLAPIWAIGVLVFWLVLARRIYTDRPAPRWPWERHEGESE